MARNTRVLRTTISMSLQQPVFLMYDIEKAYTDAEEDGSSVRTARRR